MKYVISEHSLIRVHYRIFCNADIVLFLTHWMDPPTLIVVFLSELYDSLLNYY